MKEYCVSLEIAKELKDNGFPQNSLFLWNIDHIDERLRKTGIYPSNNFIPTMIKPYISYGNNIKPRYLVYEELYSAPIAEEIFLQLPVRHDVLRNVNTYPCSLVIYKNLDNKTEVCYQDVRTAEVELFFEDKKLSHALAKMWIYLKKEGHLSETNTIK